MIWELRTRHRKILMWVGYPLFYLLCLLVFAHVTFPWDRVKNRVIAEFDAAQADASGMRLEIDELSWYWVTGLEADGVRLISPPPPQGNDAKPTAPSVFEVQSAHVDYSLLGHLIGSSELSFGIEANGGEATGQIADSDEARTLALEFAQMGIAGLPFLADAVGLPMTGAITGTVQLSLPERKLAKANGEINLTISGLAVGDGKAKIRDTIALPRVDAGQVDFVAKAADGHVKVEKFAAQGPDVELSSEGKIRLRDPFGTSRADLRLSFKFADKYKTKNDMTKGLFGEPGSKVPGLFDLDPKNKRAKGADGSYSWRISGPFAKLSFQPSRTRKKRPSTTRRRPLKRSRK